MTLKDRGSWGVIIYNEVFYFSFEYKIKSLLMKIYLKMFCDWGEALQEIYEIENVDFEDIMEED